MQEKWPFERKFFCGHEFNWYMVDRDGCIAQVNTGFGPMPVALFADEESYNVVWDYFEQLPPSTTGRPSAALCASRQASPGFDYSAYLIEAERGLFFYEETHYGPMHGLIALPQTPLTIDRVPAPVRAFLENFRLPQLSFQDLAEFNVKELFRCR